MTRPFARLRLLWRARLALSIQLAPELALALLDDERLAGHPEAERLRRRAWRMLESKEAAALAALGDKGAEPVGLRERGSSAAWVVPGRGDGGPADRSEASLELSGHDDRPLRHALKGCLAEMRQDDRAPVRHAAHRSEPASTAGPSSADGGSEAGGTGLEEPVIGFRLAVDDGGEFAILVGDGFVIGHARAGRADLPLLADLDAAHARIFWVESFHGGGQWFVEPLDGDFTWRGETVDDGPVPLRDGDQLDLATNVSLAFRSPDPASSAVRIDLLSGVECHGASHVILMRNGSGGRLRIGPSPRRHVHVADLAQEVELALEDGRFVLSCRGGIAVPGGGTPETQLQLRLPPPARVDLDVRARAAGGPPFALGLRPLPDEGGAS